MKTERPRHDALTERLLSFERDLKASLASPAAESKTEPILQAIETEIAELRAVRTSKDLDQFLQLSMMYLTAHLAVRSDAPGAAPFKATISIYYPEHDCVILVKPCFYYPGNCALRHPTISLSRGPRSRSEIGHTGRSLRRREVLYCAGPYWDGGRCAAYIQLDRMDGTQTKSALCVPLCAGWEAIVDRFAANHETQAGSATESCFLGAAVCTSCRRSATASIESETREDKDDDQSPDGIAVLNLECGTAALSLGRAVEILKDDDRVRKLLDNVVRALAGYRRERGKYKVVRTCNSLFQLLQHNLSAREIYRALLREISAICDGADVTLHLQDLPGDQEHGRRCIKLLVGVGRNFRGFLINERYGLGDGLVGQALAARETKTIQVGDIGAAMQPGSTLAFKQLMPNSCLNVAVPLFFHDLCFGVLNVEWDELALGTRDTKRIKAYAARIKPLLERLAEYLAQVLDYYEDCDNKRDFEPATPEAYERYHTREKVRRQIMDYYVSQTLAEADVLAPEPPGLSAQERWAFLQHVIDAVGYLVGFEKDLRIMVSLRERNGDQLHEAVHHGLPRTAGTAGAPLPVGTDRSVLGNCAELGIPLFGVVEDKRALRLDELCLRILRPQERQRLPGVSVPYLPCGNAEPRYEVAMPLIFGRHLLGTLDFELFALSDATDASVNEELEQVRLEGHELRGFLGWARAIAFCRAYRMHQGVWEVEGAAALDIKRFQRLCAQAIANARIGPDQENGLAAEYFRELIPCGEPQIIPEGGDGSTDPDGIALIFRGRRLGELRIEGEHRSPESGTPAFPEHPGKGPGGVVEKLMTAYYTSALLAAEVSRDDSAEFVKALGRVQKALELSRAATADPSRNAGEVVMEVCQRLHLALESEFGTPSLEYLSHNPSRYAYFLHLDHFDPQRNQTYLYCGNESHSVAWARADTEEMRDYIKSIVDKPNEPERRQALLEVLAAAGQTDESQNREFCDRLARQGYTAATVRDVLLKVLLSGERPLESREKTSFTRHVHQSREVQSAIEFNMSPFRSPRITGWFWKQSYSIIGVPILLGGEVIAVLNILRRRRDRDDFSFFKQREVDAARELKDFVSAELGNLIDCREFSVAWQPPQDGEKPASLPGLRDLADRLHEAIEEIQPRILTVACSFARRRDWLDTLCHRAFGNAWHDEAGMSLSQAKKMVEERNDVVFRFSYLSPPPSGWTQRLDEFAQIGKKVIVFHLPTEQQEIPDALPSARRRINYEECRDIEELVWLRIGNALASRTNGRAGVVLFRKPMAGTQEPGRWSLPGLAKVVGTLIKAEDVIQSPATVPPLNTGWRPYRNWFLYAITPGAAG